jgi:uncharacterized protein YqcC (DUF446 family)
MGSDPENPHLHVGVDVENPISSSNVRFLDLTPSPTNVTSRTDLARLTDLLDRIETEMRRIGIWSKDAPNLFDRYDRGELRSFNDAPTFELWLQCVFLPRARRAVAEDSLPPDSEVGVMALRQYDYHSYVPKARELLRLLNEFDDGVEKLARRG